jgi:hypothetical protein
LLSGLVHKSTSFSRRGSTVWQERATQRVAGNHDVWSRERARCESWGQVLGTNHGHSEPKIRTRACNGRVIDRRSWTFVRASTQARGHSRRRLSPRRATPKGPV